jgi:polygalacturonase
MMSQEPNSLISTRFFGHSHWKNSLIYGEGLHDISIVGQGLIWGKGLTRSTNQPKGGGNKAIGLKLCRNVNLQDFQFCTAVILLYWLQV